MKAQRIKIVLRGRNLEDILPFLSTDAIELVDENPDIVVTHGGDGVLLGSEREFPGIPKFPVRDIRTAPLCEEHSGYDKLIKLLIEDKLKKTTLIKIEARTKNKKLKAVNDIFVHNLDPVSAIRYKVWIDGRSYGEEIVGDGVGVATVHGSTAYYRSITHSIFRVGIGLAFSNSTELVNHLVLPESSFIRIQITRGPAILVSDNNPEKIELTKDDIVEISKISEVMTVYGHEIFMCPRCRKLRHPRD
ncbi:MAG TPA: hypothetical protein P5105_01145 [Victivallales bacterium]|nr:hypothetical protein [Victivallales bacterium]HRR05863.1 hypothetical protein [Victivallales bacterium]HRR28771.1 hypothetical protein [Victivallales bacterium]